MDHIFNPEAEGTHIDFTRYAAYVESIRPQLAPHVYAFASNPSHFDLSSPGSLHDAWLETFTVREAASGERHEVRVMEIDLCLLGAFHDRRIHLRYTGVTCYSVTAPPGRERPRDEHTAHGNLLTHEIRLGHGGHLLHELLFERGATFLIECADLRHSEEQISSGS